MDLSSPLKIPEEDLWHCHTLVGTKEWRSLAGKKIFITGGTGFVGKWLLATLLDADARLGLGCRITVLSRNPSIFINHWPAMDLRVEWVTGDVRDFPIGRRQYDIIIHGAAEVVRQESPEQVFMTCVEGTRRVLELARASSTHRLLLLSSGAVYGRLPRGMTHVPETHLGAPDPLQAASAYGEGKRVSEWLVAQAGAAGLNVNIARLFTAVGPHLPLDKHFAVGNFLNSAFKGEDIIINGDGTPFRSYLYASDMAAWLWAVLLRGECCRAYNVGSEASLSILELAHRVIDTLEANVGVRVCRTVSPDHVSEHYVPLTRRAFIELGLDKPLVSLEEALRRTARWHGYLEHSETKQL